MNYGINAIHFLNLNIICDARITHLRSEFRAKNFRWLRAMPMPYFGG